MSDNEYDVTIGRVTSTFGLKGEVKVWAYTDHLEQFEQPKEVCLVAETGETRILKIESVKLHKGILIKFKGVNNLSEAESLRGYDIRVRKFDLIDLDEDEFYMDDIVGLEAVTTEGESLGTIKEILTSPANDVYVTDRAMIPAVKEFVVKVDIPGRKVIVNPVEGLVQE